MHITKIEVTPLNLVPQWTLTLSYGDYPVFEYALLKIHTNVGTIGLGEAAFDPVVTGETQEGVLAALRSLAPLLEGSSPFDLNALMEMAEEEIAEFPAALAALDMALYDLMGKSLGVPVHSLLGGRMRPGMQLYPVVPMDTPEAMADMARQLVGPALAVKLKIGSDPDTDIARVAAVAGLLGDEYTLYLDVNQGWDDARTAMATIERLERYNIGWIEQPVAADDFGGLAAVTAMSEIPIMADESCHSPADALALICRQAADILNIKLMKCGGISRALDILAIAEAAGIGCIIGSMVESSIGSAAGMHVVAACRNVLASELIGPLFLVEDPAAGYPLDPETAWASVPQGPGLGVELT